MACNSDFIDFICQQIAPVGEIRYRKMFGDYMIYANDKPVVIVCDDIAYVKKHQAIEQLMQEAECGCPYEGAKEHYVLDVSMQQHTIEVVKALEAVLPYPKSRAKKNK